MVRLMVSLEYLCIRRRRREVCGPMWKTSKQSEMGLGYWLVWLIKCEEEILVRMEPPLKGEHTDEVLSGHEPAGMAELREAEAVE